MSRNPKADYKKYIHTIMQDPPGTIFYFVAEKLPPRVHGSPFIYRVHITRQVIFEYSLRDIRAAISGPTGANPRLFFADRQKALRRARYIYGPRVSQ